MSTRTARASWVLIRASVLTSLQYRVDFAFSALRALFEVAAALLPLLVVFERRTTIAGWHLDEALLVVAWFTAHKALLDGVIMPSVVQTIEQIRRGSFDFALLKPLDTQVLASLCKVEVFAASHLLSAVAIGLVALHRLHRVPSLGEAGLALLLTGSATAILYALNIAALSIAFHVARIDNLIYLLSALYDAGRWPSTVFRGGARLFFTFVLPLGLMTTYPPLALLGKLSMKSAVIAATAGLLSLVIARSLWTRAIRAYRSAGG